MLPYLQQLRAGGIPHRHIPIRTFPKLALPFQIGHRSIEELNFDIFKNLGKFYFFVSILGFSESFEHNLGNFFPVGFWVQGGLEKIKSLRFLL